MCEKEGVQPLILKVNKCWGPRSRLIFSSKAPSWEDVGAAGLESSLASSWAQVAAVHWVFQDYFAS